MSTFASTHHLDGSSPNATAMAFKSAPTRGTVIVHGLDLA